MGKGDRKTAKGKRNISSYGNARPGTVKKAAVAVAVKKEAVKKA
ncbi:MAG: 30S ribosomal protein THX, partial [Arenimonas sp.]